MEQAVIVTDNVEEIRADNKKRKRRNTVFTGILIMVFAIIGLITVIVVLTRTTKDLVNNTKQKEKWESYILPVVMSDPIPFEDAATLDSARVQKIGVWAAMLNNPLDTFARDDNNYVIIPANEVEKQVKNLFGEHVPVIHGSIVQDLSYYYEEDTNTYHYQSDTIEADLFTPKVMEIEKKDNKIYLSVIYLSPRNLWEDKDDRDYELERKRFQYVIKKDSGKEQYIYSVKELENFNIEDEIDIKEPEQNIDMTGSQEEPESSEQPQPPEQSQNPEQSQQQETPAPEPSKDKEPPKETVK